MSLVNLGGRSHVINDEEIHRQKRTYKSILIKEWLDTSKTVVHLKKDIPLYTTIVRVFLNEASLEKRKASFLATL